MGSEPVPQRPIHAKGLASITATLSFLVMTITGIVAWFMPEGRVAYWITWRFLGMTKDQWGSLHTLSSYLFVTAAAFHIAYNWRTLITYFIGRARKVAALKRELAIAAVVSLVTVAGSLRPFPPFSWVLDLGSTFKAAWVTSPEHEPPYGHAETTTMKVFAKKMNIDLAKALAALAERGIDVPDTGAKLIEIAEANGVSPMAVYAVMKPYELPEERPAAEAWTPESVEERFTGTGLGNKALPQVVAEVGIDPATAATRLAAASLTIGEGETFKKAAERQGVEPIELLQVILVEEFRPK